MKRRRPSRARRPSASRGDSLIPSRSPPAVSRTTFLPSALPSWLHLMDNHDGTALLSGTPPAFGTLLLTLKATNGTTTASHALTVKIAAGAAPRFTTGNAANFGEREPGIFTIKTTGFPAATLSVTGALPAGVTFKDNGNGTATLRGKPVALTAQVYLLTITAHNAAGANATQAFTLTVLQVITSQSATFTVGTSTPFVITTSGPATLSLIGTLPAGVTFSAATHTLSGKPAAGTGGNYTFTIVATTPTFKSADLHPHGAAAAEDHDANDSDFIVGQFASFTVRPPVSRRDLQCDRPAANRGLNWHDNSNGRDHQRRSQAGTAGTTPFTISARTASSGATRSFARRSTSRR